MINIFKQINFILNNETKIKFLSLSILLVIKGFLNGISLALIIPYISIFINPNYISNNRYLETIINKLGIHTSNKLMIIASIILIFIFLIKNIISLFITYYQSKLVFSKRSEYGYKLLNLYLYAPLIYHIENNSAELDRNIRDELVSIFHFLQSIINIFSNIIMLSSIIIVLLLTKWQVIIILGFIVSLISFIYVSVTNDYFRSWGVKILNSQYTIINSIKESLGSIIETKINNAQKFFTKTYYDYMMINAKANWRNITLKSLPIVIFEMLAISCVILIFFYISIIKINIIDIIPIVSLFLFAFLRLIPEILSLIGNLQTIKFKEASINVIYNDFKKLNKLQIKDNVSNKKNNIKDFIFYNMKLSNLNFSYNNIKTLKSINLEIKKGESIGITGPSGGGKSTLVNIILGLLDPNEGKIIINDNVIKSENNFIQHFIGYVPQKITLLDKSISENIAFGIEKKDINNSKINLALKKADLFEFVDALQNKIDTRIGENGIRLSGGQRQRIGIARALYNNPQILIFDEATSALDINTEANITKQINALADEKTIIIVAHRLSTIRNCDIIHYMKNGEILASGKYRNLIETNDDFKTLDKKNN